MPGVRLHTVKDRKLFCLSDTYEEAKIQVLVDDLPNPYLNNLLAVRGLSIFLILRDDKNHVNILFDSGPRLDVLQHNASMLNLDTPVDYAFLSVWLNHHVGGFLQAYGKDVLRKVIAPQFPGRKLENEKEVASILSFKGWFNEQILLFNLAERGIVVVIGCAIYGITRILKKLEQYDKIHAVIGGFNLSSLDVLDGPLFMRWVRKKKVEVVIPLHSTAPKARKIILKKLKSDLDWTGVGLSVSL